MVLCAITEVFFKSDDELMRVDHDEAFIACNLVESVSAVN